MSPRPLYHRSRELFAGLVVSEKMCLKVFYHESMGANDSHGVATLDPYDMGGMVYVTEH